ncbi:hypothetical protein DPSP01_006991 [Paraphaeosphaeria sporulosa]|uniref:Uncharacterized protein n=1 Tax=Paraphaeosphaeria sporulosa TaxID=1460663 RepID=A0A177CGD3_9PLEO|nr:uncharacterized protein CC84DRAFT_610492 [Paraphaeosphaeria sporulosa]OAG06653.1 hypothetical protein CC84DRAFT_610492 [Paraphaeosphaeria sporulosa]
MCGSTTCVWGFCCEQPGKACAGLSQCCQNGGCCDLYSEECCGDVCCTKPSTCCGAVCCQSGYVCEGDSRCVASATSQAVTTVRETVVASGEALPMHPPWQGFVGIMSLAIMVLGY